MEGVSAVLMLRGVVYGLCALQGTRGQLYARQG
jgi:hypothetical protein